MEMDATLRPARPTIGAAVALGLGLLTVDFTTKAVANARLPLEQLVPTSLPFFSWRLTYNTGSHYLFGAVGEVIPYRLMMAVAAILVIGLTAYLARDVARMLPSPVRTIQWLMVATLIGALGNAIEVVAIGRATDFFMIHPFPWPANLSDQFVNATVFILLPLSLWFAWRAERVAKNAAVKAAPHSEPANEEPLP